LVKVDLLCANRAAFVLNNSEEIPNSMNRVTNFTSILFILLLCADVNAQAKLQIMTEELAPFQFLDSDNTPTGVMVEVVQAIIDEANVPASIEVIGWTRAYRKTLKENNTLIFSIMRTPEREKMFNWIVKLYKNRVYVVSLNNDIGLINPNNAKEYTIGTMAEDVSEEMIRKLGFEDKNITFGADYIQLWKMLYHGRFDLILMSEQNHILQLKKLGYDLSKLKYHFEITNSMSDMYLAANINNAKPTMDKLKVAFKTIKSNGVYKKILSKWKVQVDD